MSRMVSSRVERIRHGMDGTLKFQNRLVVPQGSEMKYDVLLATHISFNHPVIPPFPTWVNYGKIYVVYRLQF